MSISLKKKNKEIENLVLNIFSLTRCMLLTVHLHSTRKIYIHTLAMSLSTLHKKDTSPHYTCILFMTPAFKHMYDRTLFEHTNNVSNMSNPYNMIKVHITYNSTIPMYFICSRWSTFHNRFFKYVKEKTQILIDQIPNDNKYLKQGKHAPKQSKSSLLTKCHGHKKPRDAYFHLSEK